nr:hypothetical protein [Nitrospirota bacterium]
MKSSPSIISRAVIASFIAMLSLWSNGDAQEPTLPKEVESTLQYFLSADCHTGVKKTPLAYFLEVKQAQTTNVQVLIDKRLNSIQTEQPDQGTLNKLRGAMGDEWERRATFLKKNPRLGLSAKYHAMALTGLKDREAYVNRRAAELIAKNREKARIALETMHSPESMKGVRKLSRTKGNILKP